LEQQIKAIQKVCDNEQGRLEDAEALETGEI